MARPSRRCICANPERRPEPICIAPLHSPRPLQLEQIPVGCSGQSFVLRPWFLGPFVVLGRPRSLAAGETRMDGRPHFEHDQGLRTKRGPRSGTDPRTKNPGPRTDTKSIADYTEKKSALEGAAAGTPRPCENHLTVERKVREYQHRGPGERRYSARNTVIGSTRVARQTGTNAAIHAAVPSTHVEVVSDIKSSGSTP